MEKQNKFDEHFDEEEEEEQEQEEEECVDCENCQKHESIMRLDGRDLCYKCIGAMNIDEMDEKPNVGFPTLKKKTVNCEYFQKPSTINVGPNLCDECFESNREMFGAKSIIYNFPTLKSSI